MTFRATVLGAAASILAFGVASAADLPSYKAPPPPPPPVVFDWSGYHIGVSGGYAGGSASYTSNIQTFGVAPLVAWNAVPSSAGTSGYIVGFQSGANWQLPNNVVVGYESEFNYSDTGSNSGSTGLYGGSLHSNLRWLGAERLRFGYAFGRVLPYITGGLSYGQVHANGVDSVGGFLFPTSASNWQAGWNVGAGIEWAVFNNVSVKAEYLYSSLQRHAWRGESASPGAFRTFQGNGFDTHIARIGLNYQIKSFGALIGLPNLGL